MIKEICVRGGSNSIDNLKKNGKLDDFLTKISLDKMPFLSYDKILKVLNEFKATRFRRSAAKTILENYENCFKCGKFTYIYLLEKNNLPKELTPERIKKEREVRAELKKHFVWFFIRRNEWKSSNWKNKPISDWLIDIGYSVNLIPFDIRWKNILKEIDIKVSDNDYEKIEDTIIQQVCSKLKLLPCQVDAIIYKKSEEIKEKLQKL